MGDWNDTCRPKTYALAQIDDCLDPPDWFLNKHPPMPQVVDRAEVEPRGAGMRLLPSHVRLPLPGGGAEPLADGMTELAQDPSGSCNPHSGFLAYLAAGSMAKDETLVRIGGSSKGQESWRIACALGRGAQNRRIFVPLCRRATLRLSEERSRR
jgi:hypothetical protein